MEELSAGSGEWRDWQALPALPLAAEKSLSATCRGRGLPTLRDLGRWLFELPYGRPADRADWRGVLGAGCGTCSTKHALLAAVSDENGHGLELCLGLYEMSEKNTPGVGPALERAGLDCVPEAHCYVRLGDRRIDVTRAGPRPEAPVEVLVESRIAPDQIGDHKIGWHRGEIYRWCQERGADPEAVWRAREACIEALRQSRGSRAAIS